MNKLNLYIMNELKQEIKDLKVALRNKTVTVNDYCNAYHAISNKIKAIEKATN